MRIKSGVILAGLKLPMRKAILAANRLWTQFDGKLIIISGLEEMANSEDLSPFGYALRFNEPTPDPGKNSRIYNILQERLGHRYWVNSEDDGRVYVQYHHKFRKYRDKEDGDG